MAAKLGTQISIRLGVDDVAQLARLERTLRGAASKTNLARAAMRLGLTLLEKDPRLVVGAVADPEKRHAALEESITFVGRDAEERIARRVVALHGKTLARLAK